MRVRTSSSLRVLTARAMSDSSHAFISHRSRPPSVALDVKQLTDRMSDANRDKRRPGRRQQGNVPVEQDSVMFIPSEPVTQEVQQVARIRRATVLPQSPADKHVIKGSMAKVIASGAGTSLQRRLLR